ncbi:MAG: hypothetical protein JWR75_1721 [Devosia sp.]|nr:hypothetical protein [Devosia sp.]
MTLPGIGRLAVILTLTAGLAGCLDMNVDVAITSETDGKVTVTQVMDKSMYDMIMSGDAAETNFCDGGETTIVGETATCVIVSEGKFDDLDFGDDSDDSAVITSAGPGLVRVSFPTDNITSEMGADTGAAAGEELDAETKAMMAAFFEGHTITFRIGGVEVTDTNMTLADDGRSAETVIPFLDLINGTTDLPDELFAIIRVE